jgi:hypothetical protein
VRLGEHATAAIIGARQPGHGRLSLRHVAGEAMMCVTSDQTVVLTPFSRADLGVVEPWFEDPQTRRFLGDSGWPRRMLELDDRRVFGGRLFCKASTASRTCWLIRQGAMLLVLWPRIAYDLPWASCAKSVIASDAIRLTLAGVS